MSGWERPALARQAPKRGAGGFYRVASDATGHAGGVPLNSANAAMVAAVRLAYDVAETQIDRSNRLARRLRDAGDDMAGPHSDRQAIDAAEQLVTKAILSGLEWWETSVAQGRCPTKRLIGAEYRLLGKILGFDAPVAQGQREPSQPPPPNPAPPPAGGDPPRRTLAIAHASEPKYRRPVMVERFEMAADGVPTETLHFFSSEDPGAGSRKATMALDTLTRLRLTIETKDWPSGRWRAAICDAKDIQLGLVEIVL